MLPLTLTSLFDDLTKKAWEQDPQCEKLLGLAGGNTKKHRNKKAGESITLIRYNVMNMYSYSVHEVHYISGKNYQPKI